MAIFDVGSLAYQTTTCVSGSVSTIFNLSPGGTALTSPRDVTVINQGTVNTVYVGGTIGTQYTGIPLGPGAQLTLQGTAVTLVGITSTGTSVVIAGSRPSLRWSEPMANTPVSATIPTVVFTPSTSGMPHAVLYNNGPAPVYLGGSAVSTSVGFALAPNDRLDLSYNGGTIWAISGYQTTSPQGTVITAATALGGLPSPMRRGRRSLRACGSRSKAGHRGRNGAGKWQ